MDKFNVSSFQDSVDRIDNTDFVKSIEAMRADYTDANKNEVLNKAIFEVVYFVPAFFDSKDELQANADDKLSFNERQRTRFVLIENPQGEKYIPAFTDNNDLLKFRDSQPEAGGCQAFVMQFADLATVIETFPNIEGFVVNPFSHNLPFAKGFVAEIKKNIMAQLEQIKSQEKKPNITMSTNTES